ncbi:CipA protein [Paramyrothecium foliicola]|nr:CipA protein [Paramyrothecium foliicola]
MAHVTKVAIVGATGTLGKYITDALLETGKHQLTVITRSNSQAGPSLPSHVQVATVDYDNQQSLVEALRGQQVLIITMSPTAPKDTNLKLVEAAAEAGVPYIIPNGWGYDPSHPAAHEMFLGPAQVTIQKRIAELGKSSWIEIVSGAWYEFGLGGTEDRFGFDLQERSVTFYDDGTARVNTTTWQQIARAVAKLLSLKEKPDDESDKQPCLSAFKNQLIYISSFYVSQQDMFESLLRVTGTQREDWEVKSQNSSERYQSGLALLQQGERTGFMRALYVRSFYPEEPGRAAGGFGPVHGLHNELLGLPEEDLDERTRVAVSMSAEIASNFA